MKISGGISEDGVIVGNTYDKYGAKNPIVRLIMTGFDAALTEMIDLASPNSIHEVGCGEGYWVLEWVKKGIDARGSDLSSKVIEMAKMNAVDTGCPQDLFKQKSIYELTPGCDSAELVVCCEVMEHLVDPDSGLEALQSIAQEYVILSVPREPLWCTLNVLRGKYISACGNTPGHIQHWSKKSFIEKVSQYFQIVDVRSPVPWTMILCRNK